MNLLDLLNHLALSGGNWVIYLLLLTSVASVYVMAERYIYFSVMSGHGQEIRKFMVEHLDKDDADSALQGVEAIPLP